jgi:hypothetical protein
MPANLLVGVVTYIAAHIAICVPPPAALRMHPLPWPTSAHTKLEPMTPAPPLTRAFIN